MQKWPYRCLIKHYITLKYKNRTFHAIFMLYRGSFTDVDGPRAPVIFYVRKSCVLMAISTSDYQALITGSFRSNDLFRVRRHCVRQSWRVPRVDWWSMKNSWLYRPYSAISSVFIFYFAVETSDYQTFTVYFMSDDASWVYRSWHDDTFTIASALGPTYSSYLLQKKFLKILLLYLKL